MGGMKMKKKDVPLSNPKPHPPPLLSHSLALSFTHKREECAEPAVKPTLPGVSEANVIMSRLKLIGIATCHPN